MKKFYTTIAIVLIFFVTNINKVTATGGGSFVQIPNPTNIDSLEELINAVAKLIVPLFVLTFLAMLLFGAFTYLTAQGDDSKIEKAKKIIVTAIIGFTLAVLAPSIANFVGGILGVEGLSF
jgi:hypothetical protein